MTNDFSKIDAQDQISKMAQVHSNELTDSVFFDMELPDFTSTAPEEKIEQFLDLVEN